MDLRVKVVNCFGALEYWSIGVLQKAKARISTSISPYRYSMLYAPCPRPLGLTVMLDIDSFDNKNHGLGYVGGEVGAALEATRDDDGVHC